MGAIVDRVRVAARTTTGDQSITFSLGGLTPKAVLLFWSLATADNTPTDGYVRGEGMADATQQASRLLWDQHNQGTSNNGTRTSDSNCIELVNDAGTLLQSATLSSFSANTVTLSWTVTTGTAILIEAIAFAGSDLSAAVSLTTLTNTVNTAHDVTDPAFEPDDVITFGLYTDQGLSFGLVHNDRAGGITQRCAFYRHRTSRPSAEIVSKISESYGGNIPSGAWASDQSCWLEFSAFDASGFTVTTRQAAPGGTGITFPTLSLRYGSSPVVSSKVYTYNTPTGTGNSTDNNPNFTPQFVLYFATLMEAAATYYDTSLAGSSAISSIVSGGQDCVAWSAEDGAGTTNTQSLIDDVAVNLPLHDGSAGMAATFVSFGATGVTNNWSDIETNAKKWLALAIGAPPSGTTVTPSAASCISSTTAPTPVLGSVTVTGGAATAIGRTADPTAILGSITYTPGAAGCIARSSDPTAIQGALSLTPNAATSIARTTDPTPVLGSVTVTPVIASSIARSIDPTVDVSGGDLLITPVAATTIASTSAPSVIQGSLTVTPVQAASIASTAAPEVILGSIAVTPVLAGSIARSIDPTVAVSGGGLTLTPTLAGSVASTGVPDVILGSITIGGVIAGMVGQTAAPDVILGSVMLTPSAAVVVSRTVDPTVILSILALNYYSFDLFIRRVYELDASSVLEKDLEMSIKQEVAF